MFCLSHFGLQNGAIIQLTAVAWILIQICSCQYTTSRYGNNGDRGGGGHGYGQHGNNRHDDQYELTTLATSEPDRILDKGNSSEIVILLLMCEQRELPVFYELVKPTIEIALEHIKIKYPHLSFRLKSRRDINTCENNVLGAMAAEEYYLHKVNAIIGPICSKGLEGVGRLASYWQVPVITAGGIGIEFSNKKTYKSLTRITFSLDRVADFLSKIIQDYDWHHISMIVDESEPMNNIVKTSIEKSIKYLEDYEMFLDIQEFSNKNQSQGINYEKLLLQSKKVARVVMLLMGGELSRNFLVHAYDMQMNNGEFVFFGIELIKTSGLNNDFSWYKAGDKNNKKAKSIYESFLSVAVRVPTSPEYSSFVNKVIKKSNEEFDNTNSMNVNPLIASFYDCVVLYAWAYNRSLAMAGNSTKSDKITKLLWNNVFQDGLTGDIVINENGDREVDYTLSDFNPETGTMQSVLTYYGRRRVIQKNDGVTVHWPNNMGSPLDIPYCGFLGDAPHCAKTDLFPVWAIILIIMSILMIIGVIVAFFALKKIQSEQDLNSNWWNIDYNEIIFPNSKTGQKSSLSLTISEDGFKSGKNSSLRTTTQLSIGHSLISAAGQFDSVLVGVYRGVKIAYKPLSIKRITMNRKMLVDFRLMRELTHENLVRFFGICMDDQNTAVVSELMIRGSLRDILEEQKLQIDWTFRYSIISDIIEGMLFIHNSSIEYHGHLKSTNCVIDGRFMVKISDYGLRTLHKQVSKETEINPRALFWTAPEHLRMGDPLTEGSKKGDIFSFAIILQEIITRSSPYDTSDKVDSLEPQEILDRLRMGSDPPFRPEVKSEDCPRSLLKVMNACWADDPNLRPDFPKIKPAMKKISCGVSSSNFLDNLLKRMEQYSENLEKIVEEKTQSIVEEKLKTEELLYQILPRYIADELKSGRHVQPEMFDSATIFFSDIVGFTILSAQSNPMQVVNLLNDLYTCFDAIINMFDAHKIETIGDAYMVASGVPIRNGKDHAKEIALMALDLAVVVDKFKIKHLPKTKLRLRIGIHSGPCAAGVVGTKMPKYLVFGDTVNTASRMESSGEPLKIHISEATKIILDTFRMFNITKRGEIEVKGKGKMTTYWLDSATDKSYIKTPP